MNIIVLSFALQCNPLSQFDQHWNKSQMQHKDNINSSLDVGQARERLSLGVSTTCFC